MVATMIDGIIEALRIGVGFLWTAAWAIIMGLTATSLVQVYVSKERMAQVLGDGNLGGLTKATAFGAASSGCSFGAVGSLEANSSRIDDGIETVDEAVDILDEIHSAVNEVNQGIAEVADATDEQAASTEEVASMVDQSTSAADQIANDTAEIADEIDEQTDQIVDIDDAVDRLVDDLVRNTSAQRTAGAEGD